MAEGKLQATLTAIQAVAVTLSAVAVPVVLAYLGNQFNAAIKEREVQGKFVELAVSILVQPANEDSRLLRVWATNVVNRYSGVPLGDKTQSQLIDKLSFPFAVTETIPAMEKGFTWRHQLPDTRAMLAELGYYRAPTDPEDYQSALHRTFEALGRFQQEHGLPTSGLTDKETRAALVKAIIEKRAREQAAKKK